MSAPAPLARRVAVVIHHLGLGGAERVVALLTERWARAGRDVTVVTLASPRGDVNALAPEVHRVSLDVAADSRSALEGAVRGLGRVRALRAALAAARPDVAVSFMPETSVLTLLAAAGRGLPVVVCERSEPRRAPLARGWRTLRRVAYRGASALVVQTEAAAAWARGLCPRVEVVPNYVEPPPRTARALDGPGPKRLYAVGRLHAAKGFDLLLEAFARVAGERPDWSLVVLGEGGERSRLEALARRLGVEGRVALPGRVDRPIDHLVDGQAFVLSSRYEGFPNALLEAMSAGLPVVAFACPNGPAEAIAHGRDGLLVPPEDVAALAAALARVMDSPEERARLGGQAREIVVRYGPERILPRWTAVLEGACARARG